MNKRPPKKRFFESVEFVTGPSGSRTWHEVCYKISRIKLLSQSIAIIKALIRFDHSYCWKIELNFYFKEGTCHCWGERRCWMPVGGGRRPTSILSPKEEEEEEIEDEEEEEQIEDGEEEEEMEEEEEPAPATAAADQLLHWCFHITSHHPPTNSSPSSSSSSSCSISSSISLLLFFLFHLLFHIQYSRSFGRFFFILSGLFIPSAIVFWVLVKNVISLTLRFQRGPGRKIFAFGGGRQREIMGRVQPSSTATKQNQTKLMDK